MGDGSGDADRRSPLAHQDGMSDTGVDTGSETVEGHAGTQTGAARPTAPENHRRTPAADSTVVPTFQRIQILRFPKMLESAKLG
jgi:hypothetical protein